ncbi:hypothetical protein [Dactylosporangium sp. CA-233914]|uniref:hypothetical protein n=1 Tax=Dactylosporangium sp. CA-233914 TaxID=3239934 RepID=UPI003D8CF95E
MNPLDLLASPLGIAAVAYAAWYTLKCAVAPWGRCRRCHGARTTGRVLRRPCPRCDGTGIRVRLGRRLYRYVLSEYRSGR